MSGQHTQRPLKAVEDLEQAAGAMVALAGGPSFYDAQQRRNAARAQLIQCVNAHDNLLASLQNMVGLAEEAIELRKVSEDPADAEMLPVYERQLASARLAIAQVTGGAG